jgi:hypothetical protein
LIPELRRGLFGFRFEDDAHVFLMAEAAAPGDFGEREMGVKEQALGAVPPPSSFGVWDRGDKFNQGTRRHQRAQKAFETRSTTSGAWGREKRGGPGCRHLTVSVCCESEGEAQTATLSYELNKATLRVARRREGRYFLRNNIKGTDPAKLWELYLQLNEVKQAF